MNTVHKSTQIAVKPKRKPKQPRIGGTAVIYPRGLEQQLGISSVTRWRMERDGRLPPRDFFIDRQPVGWKPASLQAAFAGIQPAA